MNSFIIEMTGSDTARISFTANQTGDVLTTGTDKKYQINIADGHFLRRIAGELFRICHNNFEGHVTVKVGDGARLKFHKSLWCEMSNTLTAFIWNIDASNDGNLKELLTAA